MPTVHFLGKVLPQVIQVTLGHQPIVKWNQPDVGLSMEFTSHINESRIDLECKLNRYTAEDLLHVYRPALDLCRTSVNLVSFKMGYGLMVLLETFVDPTGTKSTLLPKDEALAGLCTAYDLANGFDEVHNMVLQDWRLFDVLNDLIMAITLPHVAPVNCARATERLREVIGVPGSNRKSSWEQMRNALQIDEAYLRFITDLSTKPRHGSTDYIPGPDTTETTHRAWTVLNRYFEYRKNGNKPLAGKQFPLLVG
jgi:hypothetical protein